VIQHVALETLPADMDAAVAFWALLGFERVEPPATLRFRATWLQGGSCQVHLMLADAPVAPPVGHVAVVAADYDGTLARLREAGYDPQPRQQHWGAARAFVLAPGGHRVELMARPPA